FSLGMFRDHDVVVSLTRMTAVLIDASLRVVERLVAAEPATQPAPNNVVRPRVLPSLSFHDVHCARLREIDVTATLISRNRVTPRASAEGICSGIAQHTHVIGRVFIYRRAVELE